MSGKSLWFFPLSFCFQAVYSGSNTLKRKHRTIKFVNLAKEAIMLKIIGINLVIFIGYVLLIVGNSAATDRGFNIAIGMGVCLFIQVVLNGIAGIVLLVLNKKEIGKALLISGAALMPVGFVTWLILLSIFG